MGVHPYPIALEAAREIARQLTRASRLAGSEGEEVQLRDEVSVSPEARGAEAIVESCGVLLARTVDGLTMDMGDRAPVRNSLSSNLMLREALWMILWMCAGLGSAFWVGDGAQRAQEGLAGLNAIGTGILVATCVVSMGWFLFLMRVKTTYEVGEWGVERRRTFFNWEGKRRWERAEIADVFERTRGVGRGRVWIIGIWLFGNSQCCVALAAGQQQPAEAFKEILQRRLGMVEERARP